MTETTETAKAESPTLSEYDFACCVIETMRRYLASDPLGTGQSVNNTSYVRSGCMHLVGSQLAKLLGTDWWMVPRELVESETDRVVAEVQRRWDSCKPALFSY